MDQKLKKQALNFVNIGVACHCLALLSTMDIITILGGGKGIKTRDLSEPNVYKKTHILKIIIRVLVQVNVLELKQDAYYLTELGFALVQYRGLNSLFFEGYAELIGVQKSIFHTNKIKPKDRVDWEAIATASIEFGKEMIDPFVIEALSSLDVKGTICDLGCGAATRLIKIYEETHNPGLGFDISKEAIELAEQYIREHAEIKVRALKQDITQVVGVYEEVVLLMQYMVFHDFTPAQQCQDIMNRYLQNFPNLKYFFYVDIVAPSNSYPEMLPGYDYVHSLMDIPTRTYEETMDLFNATDFKMMKEFSIPDLPNTFFWILVPKHS